MNLYGLQVNDLKNRGQDWAVDLFRRLLWDEAHRVNVSSYLVNVPHCINVGDGGLDAVIDNASPLSDDVIPKGSSGYQIKSSSKMTKSECEKELHQKGDLKKPLKEEIGRLLKKNGTYVLVLYADLTTGKTKVLRGAIANELKRMGHKRAKVRVYTISNLLNFIRRYPGLVAFIKPELLDCIPFEIWATHRDVKMPQTFENDAGRDAIISSIRQAIRVPGDTTPLIRIIGHSGLGKTRVIFEALKTDDLKNRTVYVTSEHFRKSQLINTLQINDQLNAVLVIDECSLSDHEHYEKVLAGNGPRLAIITISHEMNKPSDSTALHQVNPLPKDRISALLNAELQGVPPMVIDRLVEFVGGYPKIAYLLIEYYLRNKHTLPDDILSLQFGALMNKLIAGTIDPASDHFQTTRRVLTAISLFEKLGFKEDLEVEAKWAAEKVGVKWEDFKTIVEEQKERGIVQGEYYIFVTPLILSIYLLRDWWNKSGRGMNIQQFVGSMPQTQRTDMFDRFSSKLPHAADTDEGKKLISDLLSKKDGLFSDKTILKSEMGGRLFYKLAQANPESALELLKSTVASWTDEELKEWSASRTAIISSLAMIAGWQDLFFDAAKLLLRLAEFENQSFANNATGVFTSLFIPAPQIGLTEVAPIDRLPILISALNAKSDTIKGIALKGFKSALQARNFIIFGHPWQQGARPFPKFWKPRDKAELLKYYSTVWTFLEGRLNEQSIREEIGRILLDSSRSLIHLDPYFSEMIKDTYRKMSKFDWISKEMIIEAAIGIRRYEGKKLDPAIQHQWDDLIDELTGTEFDDLLRRFVMSDFLEDYFQQGEKYSPQWIENKIRSLANKVIENPVLLENEYPWLTTDRAKRGYQFGYQLGKIDEQFIFLDKLIDVHRHTESKISSFLGGYFKAIFEREPAMWEARVLSISKDSDFKRFVPNLVHLSGMTSAVAERIYVMLKNGDIDIDNLSRFIYGGVIRHFPEKVLRKILRTLSKDSTGNGAIIGLQFIYFYYVHRNNNPILPKIVTLKVLMHPMFWENPNKIKIGTMVEYYWKDVALSLIHQSKNSEEAIIDKILESLGDPNGIADPYSEITKILVDVAKRNPDMLWNKIQRLIKPPMDRRAFYIIQLLRGSNPPEKNNPGLMNFFNPEQIWTWIRKDVTTRSEYVATFVPPRLFHSMDKKCLARELLSKYGKRKIVRNAFSGNYYTESFSGSSVAHYRDKKEYLLDFKKSERNENVLKWISEYLHVIDDIIKKARIEEERLSI